MRRAVWQGWGSASAGESAALSCAIADWIASSEYSCHLWARTCAAAAEWTSEGAVGLGGTRWLVSYGDATTKRGGCVGGLCERDAVEGL